MVLSTVPGLIAPAPRRSTPEDRCCCALWVTRRTEAVARPSPVASPMNWMMKMPTNTAKSHHALNFSSPTRPSTIMPTTTGTNAEMPEPMR